MGGYEEPRRLGADLAPRAASELGERNKSSLPMLSGTIAEIADSTDVRGAPWSFACSCHGCRDAGPS